MNANTRYYHSVTLDREKCKGCTACLKRCPTEAIRVRDGKASIIAEKCIDCGECIRACSHHAKVAVTDPLSVIDGYKYKAALPAPTLYGQFKEIDSLDRLLSALLAVGFDDVVEVARGAEYVSAAIREHLREGDYKKPAISSACPAILRLIQVRFPTLLDNVVDFITPMDAAAKIARERLVRRFGCDPRDVGVFFITPCPAKMTAIRSPLGMERSPVDGAISILEIYGSIVAQLHKPFDVRPLKEAGLYGVGWAAPGGEALAVGVGNAMSVDGIHNVIQVLEQLENNKLAELDFFEGLACTAGCHGGPLTFENNYVSRNRVRALKEKLGGEREELPMEGELTIDEMRLETKLEPKPVLQLDGNLVEALRKRERIESIYRDLPGLDCGSCGSPTCYALAEDIVLGQANEMNCLYKLKDKVRDMARQMIDLYDQAKD